MRVIAQPWIFGTENVRQQQVGMESGDTLKKQKGEPIFNILNISVNNYWYRLFEMCFVPFAGRIYVMRKVSYAYFKFVMFARGCLANIIVLLSGKITDFFYKQSDPFLN